MCGRFSLTSPGEALNALLRRPGFEPPPPRYNIAPGQAVAAIRMYGEERELAWLKWGLIPSWAKDPTVGHRMINARGETVADKPSFRAAFRRRRCLIPADGFYEWRRPEGDDKKQPFYIRLEGGAPFALAGLWEHWSSAEGEPVETCTIITTDANEALRPIHDRMPVILHPEDHDLWLDPGIQNPEVVRPLLTPYPDEEMELVAVSPIVNNPRNDDPGCIEPLE